MNRYRRGATWLLLFALGGCSLPGPYQTYSPGAAPAPTPHQTALTVYGATNTTPDNVMDLTDLQQTPPEPATPTPSPETASPGSSPAATSQRVAICYSRLWNSADAVHSAAAQACGTNTPRIVSQDTDLNACPALTPTHAVFSCGP